MPALLPNDNLPGKHQKDLYMREWIDDQGVTRYELRSRERKMDATMKGEFLTHFAEHGRHGSASRQIGTTMDTVKKAIRDDPEFALMVMEALECYKDKLIAHHQNLVFNGTTKTGYDRNGNVVSEEQIYPIRLIELELKKHDDGYRDKREVAVNIRGGVLVAPSEVSVEDWEAKFGVAEDAEIVEEVVVDEITDISEPEGED